MKHYVLNKEEQEFSGGFSDLFILGATRAASQASDFTDADTSQTFTLMTPVAGDVVGYPIALAYTKTAFAGTSLTAVTLDVGFDGGEEFLKDGAMFTAAGTSTSGVVVPLGTALPKVFSGSVLLTAKVDTTGANLSAITAGEIYIYVSLTRLTDILTNRTG